MLDTSLNSHPVNIGTDCLREPHILQCSIGGIRGSGILSERFQPLFGQILLEYASETLNSSLPTKSYSIAMAINQLAVTHRSSTTIAISMPLF